MLPNNSDGTILKDLVVLPRIQKLQVKDFALCITDPLCVLLIPSDAFVYVLCKEVQSISFAFVNPFVVAAAQADLADLAEHLSAVLSKLCMLEPTAHFHCIAIVYKKIPDGLDEICLYAWRKTCSTCDLVPLRSHLQNKEEGFPRLQLTSGDLFMRGHALATLCRMLPFWDILIFAIHLEDLNIASVDFHYLSIAMLNVEDLLVDSGPAKRLHAVFLQITTTPSFPKLKVLMLEGVRIFSSQQLEEHRSFQWDRKQLFLDLKMLQHVESALFAHTGWVLAQQTHLQTRVEGQTEESRCTQGSSRG